MKKYIFPSVLMFLGLSLIVYGCVTNVKPGHGPPTNNCPYEGLECPNAKHYARGYQIELTQDSVLIYDGDRFVGGYLDTTGKGEIGQIFLKDNL